MHTKYLKEIQEDHCRFYKSLEVQPSTTPASTSTLSQPYTVLKSLLSGWNNNDNKVQRQHSPLVPNKVETPTISNQSIDKALDLTLQQPQTKQQSSGRNVWPGYEGIAIARTMRNYYMQNPDTTRIEMIRALYTCLNPDVDFESFEKCVDNMILRYCSIRSEADNPNLSLDYKVSLIVGCQYFDDIHVALQHSDEYRHIV